MEKFEVVTPILVNGEHCKAGDVVELSKADAAYLVGAKRVKVAEEKAKRGRPPKAD